MHNSLSHTPTPGQFAHPAVYRQFHQIYCRSCRAIVGRLHESPLEGYPLATNRFCLDVTAMDRCAQGLRKPSHLPALPFTYRDISSLLGATCNANIFCTSSYSLPCMLRSVLQSHAICCLQLSARYRRGAGLREAALCRAWQWLPQRCQKFATKNFWP